MAKRTYPWPTCECYFSEDTDHICGTYFRDLKKKLTISYPCVMLNVDVARINTNDQYQVSLRALLLFVPLHRIFVLPSSRCDRTISSL